jgi:hypothetical protein
MAEAINPSAHEGCGGSQVSHAHLGGAGLPAGIAGSVAPGPDPARDGGVRCGVGAVR